MKVKVKFTDILLKFGYKISGFKGWLVNLIAKRLYKKYWLGELWPDMKAAWNTFWQKIEDDKTNQNLADEIAKGKDADATKELKNQDDILNGPRRH